MYDVMLGIWEQRRRRLNVEQEERRTSWRINSPTTYVKLQHHLPLRSWIDIKIHVDGLGFTSSRCDVPIIALRYFSHLCRCTHDDRLEVKFLRCMATVVKCNDLA